MIILVGSEKGGTGKTTIATNLAVMRAADGNEILLVDSDKQGSASVWADIRNQDGVVPAITCISKTGPSTGLEVVKLQGKFTDIIVDAGGRDSTELRTVMMIADKMIIPVKPSQFDIWTLTPMEQLVYDARARGNTTLAPLVCINLASTNALSKESDEVENYLLEFEILKTAKGVIRERVAFRRAAREGKAVTEITEGDNKKAVAEINALYNQVFHE